MAERASERSARFTPTQGMEAAIETTTKDYHSYLLRLWRVRDDGYHWRSSLEDVQTGELCGFENVKALVKYLEALTPQDQPKPAILADWEVSEL